MSLHSSVSWLDFFKNVKEEGGKAFFDDHHRGGTIKFLYVFDLDTVKIGGYYGAEEYDVINRDGLLTNQTFDENPFYADVDITNFKGKNLNETVDNVLVTFHKVTDPHRPPMKTRWTLMKDDRIRIDFVDDTVPVHYEKQDGLKFEPTDDRRVSFWTMSKTNNLFPTEKSRLRNLIKFKYVDHTQNYL